MTRFLFVGERPSDKAKSMGVTWRDGRLAAKQLFDALRANGIRPEDQKYTNWFTQAGVWQERRGVRAFLLRLSLAGYVVVAMGQKVARALTEAGIEHYRIVHPAARGKIRHKAAYAAHIKETLIKENERGILEKSLA